MFAKNAVAGDIWTPSGRYQLDRMTIIGANICRLYSSPRKQSLMVIVKQSIVDNIATAKAVKTRNARHSQWHLVNNRTDQVFYGFDFLSKTSIAQFCLSLVNKEVNIRVYSQHPGLVAQSARLYGTLHYPSLQTALVQVQEVNRLPARSQILFDYMPPQL